MLTNDKENNQLPEPPPPKNLPEQPKPAGWGNADRNIEVVKEISDPQNSNSRMIIE